MFSGIVEGKEKVISSRTSDSLIKIQIQRPKLFEDLSIGDSVAVDGVCLTIEDLAKDTMAFSVGSETQKVTGWSAEELLSKEVNLERSLRLGDRVHGHLVSGHVDLRADVKFANFEGGNLHLGLTVPPSATDYIWPKGSVTLNGVSLTVNQVKGSNFTVGLIPETLRQTNLGTLQEGDSVNLEVDSMARAWVHQTRQFNHRSNEVGGSHEYGA